MRPREFWRKHWISTASGSERCYNYETTPATARGTDSEVAQFPAVPILFSDVVNDGALLVFAGEIFDHPGHLPQPLACIDHLQQLLFLRKLDVKTGRHDE